MKILIEVQCYNRKPITEIVLNQLNKYKGSADIQIVNDHSTEYDKEWLSKFGQVIEYDEKLTINILKYRSFKRFLDLDYDYFYMCDNDAFHDPNFLNKLKELHNNDTNLPITLYRSSFIKKCNAFRTIQQVKGGEIRHGLCGGISVFFTKQHIKTINERLVNCTEEEWIHRTRRVAWDSQFQQLFDRKFLIPSESHIEHFGVTGQNHVTKKSDMAMEPTKYLIDKSPEIWKQLEDIYDEKYFK